VAVLEPRVVGDVPARAFAAMNQSVTPELRKLEGISAISAAEIKDMLGAERQKQLAGCSEDATSCFEELAGALDADEMITIDLTLVGPSYALSVRRIDLRKSQVVQTQLKQLEKRDGEELLAVVGPVIEALYPDRPLKPGKTRGVEPELVRRLNPPPLPRWVFFTTASLALATSAAGGGFAYLSTDAQKDFNSLAKRSLTEEVRGPDLLTLEAKARTNASTANMLFIGAAGLAAIAAVELFFTDWRDDRAALSAQPVAFAGGGGGVLFSWTR
jgi:hypothetical protein